jgi:hypothetical protein
MADANSTFQTPSAPNPAVSPAKQCNRCRIAADAAAQIEALSNTLQEQAAKLDIYVGPGAAVLAMAMRTHTLSRAILGLLDDPIEPTETFLEMVTNGLATQP